MFVLDKLPGKVVNAMARLHKAGYRWEKRKKVVFALVGDEPISAEHAKLVEIVKEHGEAIRESWVETDAT